MPEAHACGPLDVGHVFESAGRTITESDIVGFACLSGDFNRLHVDHEYEGTPFGQRIAHGLLVLSVLSGLTTSPAATAAWSPCAGADRSALPLSEADLHRRYDLRARNGGRKDRQPPPGKDKVVFRREAINQRGEVVAQADFAMLMRPMESQA